MASNFRIPSAAPSEAWIRATACPSRRAPSTLLKPDTTWPALAAIARASPTPRTSRASVSVGQRGRDADLALEALAKLVTPDGFRNRLPRGRNPEAPAGKLALQIRDDLARGGDDKPDQFVDRPHRSRDRAHPLGRGPVGPRSVVEIGVGDSKHACDISPVICALRSRRTGSQFRRSRRIKPAGLRWPRPRRSS